MAEKRGLFQTIFGGVKSLVQRTRYSWMQMLSGHSPTFSPWRGEPYAADAVRAAVDAIARNAAKLKPKHVRRVNNEIVPTSSQIERLLQIRPNPNMSTYDFLYKLITTQMIDNNAFAYPVWEGATLGAIWPINCVQAEFLEADTEAGSKEIFVRFYFGSGNEVVLPYSEVLHLRRHFYKSDMVGENNDPINTMLEAIDTTNQGITQAIKTSANLRGIMKYQGMLKEDDIKKNRDRFVDEYMSVNNSGGIAALDGKADYTPLTHEPKIINAPQMKEMRDSVYRYWGVNEAIVMGKYTEEEYNAFYESVLEPIALQLSLEFTAKLFTLRERGHGNEIVFEANRLQYASVKTKLELREMVDRGALTPNEWREVFNLAPVEGGDKPIRRLDTKPTDYVGEPADGKEDDPDGKE